MIRSPFVACFVLFSLLFVSSTGRAQVAGNTAQIADGTQRDTPMVRMIAEVEPAMVALFSADKNNRVLGSGSGVVIHGDGYVLTNDHVLRTEQGFALLGQKLARYKVIGRLPEKDLAIVRLSGLLGETKVAPLGHSHDAKNGETILVFGNPGGRGITVTAGIISARKMVISFPNALVASQYSSSRRDDFIQFDAAVNSGNSGGPLVNMDGEVIGIVARMLAAEQNVSFAIPVDRVRDLIGQIVEPELTAGRSVGVRLNSRSQVGLISVVAGNSAAKEAGIQAGDIIESLNNKPVRHAVDWNLLLHQSLPIADALELVVRRDGQTLPLKVTPKKLPPLSSVEVENATTGLRYKLFEGEFKKLPEYDELDAADSGIVDTPNLDPAGERTDSFSLTFAGFVRFPDSGFYRVTIKSDDGSRVLLHDKLLIDHGGTHPATEASKRIHVKAGLHPIRVDYFQGTGQRDLSLTIEKLDPDAKTEPVTPEYCYKANEK